MSEKKFYDITLYETWVRTVRVEADTVAQALKAGMELTPGEGGEVHFLEEDNDHGITSENVEGFDVDEYLALGLNFDDDDTIGGLHSISEVTESEPAVGPCIGCQGRLGWYAEDVWIACMHCPEGRANVAKILASQGRAGPPTAAELAEIDDAT